MLHTHDEAIVAQLVARFLGRKTVVSGDRCWLVGLGQPPHVKEYAPTSHWRDIGEVIEMLSLIGEVSFSRGPDNDSLTTGKFKLNGRGETFEVQERTLGRVVSILILQVISWCRDNGFNPVPERPFLNLGDPQDD